MTDRSGSRTDHVNLAVPDLRAAAAFYEPVLASIGIELVLDIPADPSGDRPAMIGYGWPDRKPFFWLVDEGIVGSNMHLAFTVDSREQVHDFHRAALAAGATSRIGPGLRPAYHADYYGAVVDELHGIDLEAVCHAAPAEATG